MSQELPRPQPQSSVQAAAGVASDVVGSLKQSPALLVVVLLNLIALGGGVWFMEKLLDISQQNMRTILNACFDDHRQDRAQP